MQARAEAFEFAGRHDRPTAEMLTRRADGKFHKGERANRRVRGVSDVGKCHAGAFRSDRVAGCLATQSIRVVRWIPPIACPHLDGSYSIVQIRGGTNLNQLLAGRRQLSACRVYFVALRAHSSYLLNEQNQARI
jgi:hypothetical protein